MGIIGVEFLYAKNIYIGLITLVTVVVAVFVFLTVRAFNTEIYCAQKADELSIHSEAILMSPTMEERYDMRLKESNLITPYYREFLKCKREQFFFVF